ncbi:MAG: hypothetical protein NTU78_17190 [Alphaproteobacteria bacterium]|nr:hypothetical protein [Alphaproteobacteria bacterium]
MAAKSLLSLGRKTLASDALFSMPGFVRLEATAFMAAELEARLPWASRYESMNDAYGYDEDQWPEGHPRTARSLFRYHQVLNHQISNDSPLRKIYCWEPLREFLRQLMGYETFHRSECPHLALTAKIAGEGDTDGWHFDGNDVVFSVLLRAPEQGGQFEYVPNIRTDAEQNYDDVAAVLAGSRDFVRVAKLAVGDLNVFQGDQTLHRVSPVVGNRKRIVGLFSYDRQSGTNFGESYISQLRRRTPAYVPLHVAAEK